MPLMVYTFMAFLWIVHFFLLFFLLFTFLFLPLRQLNLLFMLELLIYLGLLLFFGSPFVLCIALAVYFFRKKK